MKKLDQGSNVLSYLSVSDLPSTFFRNEGEATVGGRILEVLD